MKCMVIAALAFVATVHAKPYGIGLGGGLGGLGGGVGLGLGGLGGGLESGVGLGGIGPGIGMGGLGGYGSGGGYGNAGYVGSSNGFGNTGFGGSASNVGHNLGHQESDFDSEVHHHQSSGHDIGGAMQVGQGGHSLYGQNAYGAGQQGFGNGYSQGGYLG